MIKVSVLYPNSGGAKFDIDYYCNKHMPMVRDRLGDKCVGIAVEKGIAGAAPGASWPYVAMAHFFFESVDDFHRAFDPNADAIMADRPNFTNVQPEIQVSDVMINARRNETGSLRLHK